MNRYANVAAARLSLLALACAVAPRVGAQQRMPSEALHDVAKGRLENLRWTPVQAESALKPVLASVRVTGLPPEEEVALALAYFFTFDGLSARPLFEKHRDRDDALGRVSWQSLQQMSFFGAKDYALVEQRTKEYRRKFPPTMEDMEYTFNMVNNLTRLAAGTGDHSRAASLVVEDIAQLPLDVPFRSFDLLGQRYASFRATGRATEALTWMKRHRDALRAAQTPESAAPTASIEDATRFPHRAGVVHLTPFVDLLLPDDPRWTRAGTVRYQRARALEKLDRWIAAAERGDSVLVP